MSNKIIGNKSKGYGYTYSNLADLAREGINIPMMRTQVVDGHEYVFAKVGDEWIQGARVVPFEVKGMNAAQAYGAALTYARRYTVQLVEAIACDDDDKCEDRSADDRKAFDASKSKSKIDFDEVRVNVAIIDDIESLNDYWQELSKLKPTAKMVEVLKKIFADRKAELAK